MTRTPAERHHQQWLPRGQWVGYDDFGPCLHKDLP